MDSKPSSGSTTDPPPPTSTPGDEDPPMAPKHHSARPGSKLCETFCTQQHYTVQHYWCSSGCATWPAVMPLPATQYWANWCCQQDCKLCDIWRSNADITAWCMVLGSQELCDMGASQWDDATREEGMTGPHQAKHHWWMGTSGEGSGQIRKGYNRRDHSRWKKGLCNNDVSNYTPVFMDTQTWPKLSVMFHRGGERAMGDIDGSMPEPNTGQYFTSIILYILRCDN